MTYHQKPILGTQLNSKQKLARGLVGCWLFNEVTGDIILDSGLEGHNGTNSGANWIPLGLNFAGAEKVQLAHSIVNNLDAFTISARFNGAAGGIVYAEGYNGDAGWALFLGIEANDPWSARFYFKENGNWIGLTTGITTVNDGWHTVSLSQKNKSSRTIYVDGIPEETDTDTVGDMSTLNTANIGVLERDTFGSYFVGDVAYVHIHDWAFSDSDAKEYNRNPHRMFKRSMIPALTPYTAPGGVAPTGVFYGPLVGPLGGPI